MTPGALAAHATGRPLAVKAKAQAARALTLTGLEQLSEQLLTATARSLGADHAALWSYLRTSGTLGRLLAAGSNAEAVLRSAAAVVTRLPASGERTDRRLLAEEALDDPHGLDDGQPATALALAIATGLGLLPQGLRSRDAWQQLGVAYDDLVGGLLCLGVAPLGWTVPPDAAVTLPPRELERATWPAPPVAGGWLFVTENPSVLAAAAARRQSVDPSPVICTLGTPSALEVAALAALASAGWRLAVRADFDTAGLNHVRAMLAGIPGARPWRMGAADYQVSVSRSPTAPRLDLRASAGTPWAPHLAAAMRATGVVAYEESLMPELCRDIAMHQPPPQGYRAGDAFPPQ